MIRTKKPTDNNNDFLLPPDPERVMEGLRDTGYNFNTALADIIDNSIAADATKIDITIDLYNMLYNNNGIILIDIENEKEISILNEYGININDFYNILFQVLNKYELNKYKRFVEIKCSYLDDGRQCFIYKIRFEKSNIDMVKLINGGNKND